MKIGRYLVLFVIFGCITGLLAQESWIDPELEKQRYPDLLATEAQQDVNILDAYSRLGTMGRLVAMAKRDRERGFKELAEPLVFKHIFFRELRFTPRNTYVRYVKEDKDFLLAGFSDTADETLADIQNRIQIVSSQGVQAKPVVFNTREGIELTQYDYIYSKNEPSRPVIGSKRKTATLFFTQDPQNPLVFQLEQVVLKVLEHDQRNNRLFKQVIIDPSPLTKEMDDIIIIQRYNTKPMQVTLLAEVWNSSNYPHRTRFKQKFLVKQLDHFFRLYRMVDGFAESSGNGYREKLLDELEKSNRY